MIRLSAWSGARDGLYMIQPTLTSCWCCCDILCVSVIISIQPLVLPPLPCSLCCGVAMVGPHKGAVEGFHALLLSYPSSFSPLSRSVPMLPGIRNLPPIICFVLYLSSIHLNVGVREAVLQVFISYFAPLPFGPKTKTWEWEPPSWNAFEVHLCYGWC